MAQADGTDTLDKLAQDYRESLGAGHNRAGLADMGREVQHTREEENRHNKGAPDDPRAREALRRAGLL